MWQNVLQFTIGFCGSDNYIGHGQGNMAVEGIVWGNGPAAAAGSKGINTAFQGQHAGWKTERISWFGGYKRI